ncbi:hypothetical protein GHT09_002465 [Marmota monax]|uniref:Uncharacterized protein n=1 Tax=Marmota monax TaxID=9995 RepID=A0A834UP63_MARMO|nr:hypothetical protein GHT09_002465 [Marmota monax]
MDLCPRLPFGKCTLGQKPASVAFPLAHPQKPNLEKESFPPRIRGRQNAKEIDIGRLLKEAISLWVSYRYFNL